VLEGTRTPLVAGDRLGFTGAATFAVTGADGTLVASTRVDFTALGSGATVADALGAINAGLGGAATASFAGGKLTITAAGATNGVVVAQDAAAPSNRAGAGFSQFFGLNDLVRSDGAMLTPAGLQGSDPHGFAPGQATEFALRDTSGRMVASYSLKITASTGPGFDALVADLNASPIAAYGSFALDGMGRLGFSPKPSAAGSTLSTLSDTTDRGGTGVGLAAITGLGGRDALATGEVRREIATSPDRLPLARLQNVAVGQKALGPSDRRGAATLVDALAGAVDLGDAGSMTMTRFAAVVLGDAGSAAARATDRADQMSARRDDAINRRDTVSGVNIDEELGQMVVLQNSYAAAARVMTTASEMYDTLLGMIR